jgi:hypothetical protein
MSTRSSALTASGRRDTNPARGEVAAGGYGAGDATAAVQVLGSRTASTTCRMASMTNSG